MSNPKEFKNNEERIKYLDNQCEELAKTQESNLVFDFDKAMEEATEDFFNVKLNNKIFKVASSMPIGFATFFFRHCLKNNKFDIPDEKFEDFLILMFGKDFVKEAELLNVPTSFLFEKMAMPILNKWGYKANPDEFEKQKAEMEKKIQKMRR